MTDKRQTPNGKRQKANAANRSVLLWRTAADGVGWVSCHCAERRKNQLSTHTHTGTDTQSNKQALKL